MMTTANIMNFFASLVQDELGIIYSEENYYQLEGRLKEVAREFNLAGVAELYEVAGGDHSFKVTGRPGTRPDDVLAEIMDRVAGWMIGGR